MSVVKDFETFKRFNFGQLQIDGNQSGSEDPQKQGGASGGGGEAGASSGSIDKTNIEGLS